MSTVSGPLCWFALHVRSQHEFNVATCLEGKGYEQFVPSYTTRPQRNRRMREQQRALFSGYIFCRFDANRRLPILVTPGVLSIVSLAGYPQPIEDAEVEALRLVQSSDLQREPWKALTVGSLAEIVEGPLAGLTGRVTVERGQHRLILQVSLLQRAVAVEIQRDWLRPAAPPQGSCHVMQAGSGY